MRSILTTADRGGVCPDTKRATPDRSAGELPPMTEDGRKLIEDALGGTLSSAPTPATDDRRG